MYLWIVISAGLQKEFDGDNDEKLEKLGKRTLEQSENGSLEGDDLG